MRVLSEISLFFLLLPSPVNHPPFHIEKSSVSAATTAAARFRAFVGGRSLAEIDSKAEAEEDEEDEAPAPDAMALSRGPVTAADVAAVTKGAALPSSLLSPLPLRESGRGRFNCRILVALVAARASAAAAAAAAGEARVRGLFVRVVVPVLVLALALRLTLLALLISL